LSYSPAFPFFSEEQWRFGFRSWLQRRDRVRISRTSVSPVLKNKVSAKNRGETNAPAVYVKRGQESAAELGLCNNHRGRKKPAIAALLQRCAIYDRRSKATAGDSFPGNFEIGTRITYFWLHDLIRDFHARVGANTQRGSCSGSLKQLDAVHIYLPLYGLCIANSVLTSVWHLYRFDLASSIAIVLQFEPKHDTERLDAVAPSDFLAFEVCATSVGDGHLINTALTLCKFGGHLRLHAKPIAADRNGLEQIGTSHFVAGFHVGQIQICKHVGEQREVKELSRTMSHPRNHLIK